MIRQEESFTIGRPLLEIVFSIVLLAGLAANEVCTRAAEGIETGVTVLAPRGVSSGLSRTQARA